VSDIQRDNKVVCQRVVWGSCDIYEMVLLKKGWLVCQSSVSLVGWLKEVWMTCLYVRAIL